MNIGPKEREDRFKALYMKYYASFCLFARRFIDNAEICEDLVSDVFVNLWSRMDYIDTDSPTTVGFIKMCVHNACLNYLKHNRYEKEYSQSLKDLDLIYEDYPESVPSLEQLYAMLLETLEKLPESHRQVFVKTYFEGRKQEEIADEMNISVKSVGRYKQRTIEFLREELKDCLPLLIFILGCGG
ncbi:MAG: RNA polymerase sigma-70 factor [Candidatus Cryptobacteroides sp.]